MTPDKRLITPLECWTLVVSGQKRLMHEFEEIIKAEISDSKNESEKKLLLKIKSLCKDVFKRSTLLCKQSFDRKMK